MTKFAFYGSLRAGMYNYSHWSEDLKFIETIRISGKYGRGGFIMKDFGPYPMCIESVLPADSIVVDLMEVEDQRVAESIDRMERGAGYVPITITHNNIDYTMYIYENDLPELRRVEGGDWNKYCDDKEEYKYSL